jgi:glycosyltransferase involved in cell wall biosynthesis
MNVLFINDGDRGGSIIAMNRLHKGLKKSGVHAKILNRTNRSGCPDTVVIPRSRIVGKAEGLLLRATARLGLNDIHCVSTFSIRDMPVYREADILDFHTIHGGFFNYLALPQLTAGKPGVLTLHDMWALTGHCSFSFGCDRWKTGCGKCPYPTAYPPVKRDNTRLEWKLKNWVYGRSNLAVVAPSRWLADQAKDSMLSRFPIHHIPHGVETDVYRPLNRQYCRAVLGIPENRKVLSFMAMRMDPNDEHTYRKGCDLLVEALKAFPEDLKSEVTLLLIGAGGQQLADSVGIDALDLGYVSSDHLKAVAYSASDLFIFPTRADNMPLVLIESIACGTPIVSFGIGGVGEMVRTDVTGHLAEPENVADFRDGIVRLLRDDQLRDHMRRRCREIALKEYPLDLQVQSYLRLYRELLEQGVRHSTLPVFPAAEQQLQ